MSSPLKAASSTTPPVGTAEYVPPKAPSIATDTKPGGEMGKDAFLQLLVAQMKNQDPLNPTDGAQMATQLAQFSSVEQLENANSTLTEIANAVRVANAGTKTS